MSWRHDSNGCPYIFDHAEHVPNAPVGIAALLFAVQKLFPLPVLLAAILNFGSLSSSTNVGQRRQASGSVIRVKSKSCVVDNVEEAIGIAAQSTTV